MVSLVELLTRSKFMGGSIRNEGDARDFECSNGVEKSWVYLLLCRLQLPSVLLQQLHATVR